MLLADGGDLFTFDAKVVEEAVRELHDKGQFTPDMLGSEAGRALIGENFRVLSEGIARGEAKAEASGLRNEVPAELSAALTDNALLFAGFKAYHTMNEAGLSLRDAGGGIKGFETFKRDAGEVFKRQGLNLAAEYRHAAQSAQMAAKWREIEADGDRYDLQYRTAGDERVRDQHAELDGVTLPPSDAFWLEYYPPNGWGCRCTAVQVRKGKYPQSDSGKAIECGGRATPSEGQKIFRFNSGAQKRVFPVKHPNFPKGCGQCKEVKLVFDSDKAICRACKCIDAGKVKVSRDFIRQHYQRELKDGDKVWNIGIGGVDKLNVSYQDIKKLSGKAHQYPYARNMAIYYLKRASRQGKYLGKSDDIKGVEAAGHGNIKQWHYIEFSLLGGKSILVVKELDSGIMRPHHIQDDAHFDYDKIQNKDR